MFRRSEPRNRPDSVPVTGLVSGRGLPRTPSCRNSERTELRPCPEVLYLLVVLRPEPLEDLEQAIVLRAVPSGHCVYLPPASPHRVSRMSLIRIDEPHTAVGFDHFNECPKANRVEATFNRIAQTRQRLTFLPLDHPRERLDEKVVWTVRVTAVTSRRHHVLQHTLRLFGPVSGQSVDLCTCSHSGLVIGCESRREKPNMSTGGRRYRSQRCEDTSSVARSPSRAPNAEHRPVRPSPPTSANVERNPVQQ